MKLRSLRITKSRSLAVAVTAAALFSFAPSNAATADKELAVVRGDVSYRITEGAAPKRIAGSQVLPDGAFATTAFKAAAEVRMPDSSIIQIGDNTNVQIGAFRPDGANGTVINLKTGALRFTIVHPAGKQSNYTFKTSTSQLAVRGTLAYLIVGPRGTQLYCVECGPGDISMTTSVDTYSVVSGQTLNIRTVGSKAFDADIQSNVRINNPAIDQFLHGYSPFGEPMEKGTDFTGSGSGTSR
jgi:hypothetical protein